ncbi:MAG: GNAT family N-acetyltransferase [Gemmatimonadetes bacterium]|nr:GNAT family N-acetyltransferase [Gemmatimonadota bacterium]
MSDPIAIETFDSIADIDPSVWNEVAPGHPMASHGWLLTLEQTCRAKLRPVYLLSSSNGRPCAATLCTFPDRTNTIYTPDHLFFGRFRPWLQALGMSLQPVTICNPLGAHGAHIGTAASLTARETAPHKEALVQALETIARERGSGLIFTALTDEERDVRALLDERRYRTGRDFATCALDIRWQSFDDYTAELGRKHPRMPRTIRNERNRVRKSGVRIERIEDARPHDAALHELGAHHMEARAGRPFPFEASFFPRLLENMQDSAHLFGAFQGTELAGFSLMVERNGVAVVYLMGLDPGRGRNDLLYFVLGYDEPIEEAIRRGFQTMQFGGTHYELKARRGCFTIPSDFRYRAPSPLRGALASAWIEVHTRWMDRKNRTAHRFQSPDRFQKPAAT